MNRRISIMSNKKIAYRWTEESFLFSFFLRVRVSNNVA